MVHAFKNRREKRVLKCEAIPFGKSTGKPYGRIFLQLGIWYF
jgi:hypothetical protein